MGVNQGEKGRKKKNGKRKRERKIVVVHQSNVLSTSIVCRRWRAGPGAGHIPTAIVASSASAFATLSHGIPNLRTYLFKIACGIQLTQWPKLTS